MNQLVTRGIVLARTDYGEADRILTILTPDQGKLRLLAKGVKKMKSKLAGGIELFSVSQITFIRGRGEIGTLVSSRLQTHYGHIVSDIERVQLGYEIIKLLDKATEDEPERDYFHLLQEGFAALDDGKVEPLLVRSWFQAQLLKLAGHMPNLQTEPNGQRLDAAGLYDFSLDDMSFIAHPEGSFAAPDIKAFRLLFTDNSPLVLQKVQGIGDLLSKLAPLTQTMYRQYIRV